MNDRWRRVRRLKFQEKYHGLRVMEPVTQKDMDAVGKALVVYLSDHPQTTQTRQAITEPVSDIPDVNAKESHKDGIFQRVASKVGSWFSEMRRWSKQ